ncbi:MAG: hypothetical protein HYS22_02290 [Deltaproteobacteria bacterium]|nr:hypothetical protein [Deltaproteobacteria bacterium]
MQALLNIEPGPERRDHPGYSRWTEGQKREVIETVLFWLEFPQEEEVSIEFLRNHAIRIQYDRLPELAWTEITYERFGTMLQKCGVRRVWFG